METFTDDNDSWNVVGKRKKPPRTQDPPTQDDPYPNFHTNSPNTTVSHTDAFHREPASFATNSRRFPKHSQDTRNDKITEPCWFYNNGGCRHKDGTEKKAEECKYMHLYSDNVRRPPHLCTKKPCDKYNLEGECRWHDNCKYSHRNLSPEEWSRFYPGIPYTLRTNIQKRIQIEHNINSVESRLNILEFKQDGISRDLQQIGQIVRRLQMRSGTTLS